MKLKNVTWLLGCSLVMLGGCASVVGSYRQILLVSSNPPGAKILERGKDIGVTPAYVPVRRRHHPELELAFPDGERAKVSIHSKYRWGDSFGLNFLLLSGAPIGWGVDWLTETAWRMENPPLTVEPGARARPPAKISEVAVAPPAGADTDVADAVGELVEKNLKQENKYKVLDYQQTAPVFGYYDSDRGLSDRQVDINDLYHELNVDHVFVSEIKSKDDGFLVTGKMRDIYTGQDSGARSWEISNLDEDQKDKLGYHRFFTERFHFFPNTLFLNLSSSQPQITIDQGLYKGTSQIGQEWYDKAANYISFLSLSHMERPRRNVRSQWKFDFVPTINFSHKRIEFETYAPLSGIQFDRLYANAGYGIEVGYLSRYGFAYFDYIPSLTWIDLKVRSANGDGDYQTTAVTPTYELGYSYFFSPHFVAKVFARTLTEDSKTWQNAVRKATHASQEVTNSTSNLGGIAIGYYFPSSFEGKSRWRMANRGTK